MVYSKRLLGKRQLEALFSPCAASFRLTLPTGHEAGRLYRATLHATQYDGRAESVGQTNS